METWDKLPLDIMDRFAELESYNRRYYRPVYSIHKWWAPRPGSTFRTLGLACLTDSTVTRDDILTRRESGWYDGIYLDTDDDRIDPDATVLDPFCGRGVTLVELNRLGADVIGYELNPVAWWTTKKATDDVDVDLLRSEYNELIENVREDIGEYYRTKDPQTGDECEVLYFFQNQVVPCLSCEETVELFPRFKLMSAKKTRPGFIYCSNEDCDNRIIKLNEKNEGDIECPNCGNVFDPMDGNYSGGKFICPNGHKNSLLETLQRLDKKPDFEYFAIEYIDPKGDKNIKEFTQDDQRRVEEARDKLESEFKELPIPEQNIPPGDKTKELQNYNYESFDELFTDRHLLTFGILFNQALEIAENGLKTRKDNGDSQNIAEFLITAISHSLTRNSKLCPWGYTDGRGINAFNRHAFDPPVQPIEANPINSKENVASLDSQFSKIFDGKSFCHRPYEKIRNDQTGKKKEFYMENESVVQSRRRALRCKTSENLVEEDNSIDYVITDPPYYDNIQYSELSDYFYVWLHEVLSDYYDQFSPELVPKSREIVKNNTANKNEEFFIETLTNVFNECYRVLKEAGEMVFTYHHNENEAWSVILQSIIDSGFTITGAYPVQSEMPGSMHIADLDNAEYDILIFANKESLDEQISLHKLQENLHFELQDIINEERERHENLSEADLGVILRGKCMYYYSKHHPHVYHDGEQVSVDEALDAVDEIIQQIIDSTANVPQSIDPISQAYAALYERYNKNGPEGYDDLNKHLLARNLNVSDLEAEKLVKGPRNEKEPVGADERVHHVETKLNGSSPTAVSDDLLDIDKVHYLYNLYKTDQNTAEYLKAWDDPDIQELADFMADVTGDERYSHVMEMTLSQFES